jgi:hypothetical protein
MNLAAEKYTTKKGDYMITPYKNLQPAFFTGGTLRKTASQSSNDKGSQGGCRK